MRKTVKTTRLLICLILIGLLTFSVTHAGKYPFGYKWQTYSINDIEVYYPDGYDPYALYMANRAMVHLDSLQSWYGVRPAKTRIVLNPGFDSGNAIAIVQPLRVEVQLTPVLDKGLRPQAGLYLDRVLAHELTHVIQFSKVAGITWLIRPVFGDAIAPLAVSPDWMNEGQAIWTESEQGGGRLHSSYHKMLIRTPLIEGKLWNLTQASQPGLYSNPANRAYITGSYLYREMIANRNGYGNANRWMYYRAKYPGLNGLAFKWGFHGRKAKIEYDRMIGTWRSELRGTINQRRDLGFANGLPLLKDKRTDYKSPVWIDNSTIAVYEKGYNRPNRIVYVYNDTEFPEILKARKIGYTAHNGITKYGDGVLFSRIERDGFATERDRSKLRYMNRKGRIHNSIDGEKIEGWAPAWNEKTSTLAYIARTETGAIGLYLKSQDSPSQLLLETNLGMITDPGWNDNGDMLTFSADMGENETTYLYDLKNETIRELQIDNAQTIWDPTFAPNGNLWVSADFFGIFDLFEIDLADTVAFRRTRVLTGAMEPSISPDGENIAYIHYTADGFDLAVFPQERWAADTTAMSIRNVDKDFFHVEWPEANERSKTSRYYSLLKTKPRFWLPWVGGEDENAMGAAIMGRDPLGLLSWNSTVLYGEESEELDFAFSTTYRGLPISINGRVDSYPEEKVWFAPEMDSNGNFLGMKERRKWKRQTEGSVTLFQNIYMDRTKRNSFFTPYGGVISREEYVLKVPDYSLEAVRFNGFVYGWDISNYLSARRDPVPRHYSTFKGRIETLESEKYDFTAELVEGSLRKHIPGPIKQTVLAFYGNIQKQTGPLEFSRYSVRPRGYHDSDLKPSIYYADKMSKIGAEYYFPILFPDFGLGLGWIFTNSVTGSIFAESTTGGQETSDLSKWFGDESVSSYGAEIDFGGRLFYNADIKVIVGGAYRSYQEDVVYYFRMGFPSPLTGTYEGRR